jgi:transcriptional regulator with XRE-family HTH domain
MGTGRTLFTHPLAYIRDRRGWSQSNVAEIVARNSSLNMASWRQKVYRWERGVRPELPAQYALARELGIDVEFVTAHPWPGWLLYVDDAEGVGRPWTPTNATRIMSGTLGAYFDRRAYPLLADGSLTALAASWAEPWRFVPPPKVEAATAGGNVDDEILRALERRSRELWTLDDAIGGAQCARLADADLRLTVDLLQRGRYTGSIERRLYALAAGLCRSAGWGSFDADLHAAADRYWHAGIRAAHQAGDPAPAVYILSNMALQQNQAGDGRTAIGLLDGARTIIGPGGPAIVHAILDAWQVRSHALQGERLAAGRILGRADDHWDRHRIEDTPEWTYWMRRPSETIEANMALVTLGQTNETEARLNRWIATDGADFSRDHAFALTVIAAAQLDSGRLDESLETARQAVALLRRSDSGRIADELSGFAGRLPDGEPAAAEFRAELREVSA